MSASEIVAGIIRMYSDEKNDEIHCRMSELTRKIVNIVEALEREIEQTNARANAWKYVVAMTTEKLR